MAERRGWYGGGIKRTEFIRKQRANIEETLYQDCCNTATTNAAAAAAAAVAADADAAILPQSGNLDGEAALK